MTARYAEPMSQHNSASVVTSNEAPLVNDRLVLEPEVEAMIPMHRSTRYRKAREGTFPAPIWISKNRRAWRLSALLEWIANLEQNPIKPRAYFGSTNGLEAARKVKRERDASRREVKQKAAKT